eukprot:14053736-Alexandrium_andersonii.AAC.1
MISRSSEAGTAKMLTESRAMRTRQGPRPVGEALLEAVPEHVAVARHEDGLRGADAAPHEAGQVADDALLEE